MRIGGRDASCSKPANAWRTVRYSMAVPARDGKIHGGSGFFFRFHLAVSVCSHFSSVVFSWVETSTQRT
jgi:hypothetical protein